MALRCVLGILDARFEDEAPVKLHPRHNVVVQARHEMSAVVIAVAEKYKLTFAELLLALTEELLHWAALQVKDERAEEEEP
jgi:hypothetical protein